MIANGNRRARLEPTAERDYCTRSGAEVLAGTIREFWAAFGHPDVLVWIEEARGAKVLDRQKLAARRLAARLAVTGIVKPAAVGLRSGGNNNPDNSNRIVGLPGWIPVPG
jgi:hypothetical protein